MGLRDAAHRRGRGGESTEILGTMNLPWQGYEKNSKIEAYAGMEERLMRDFVIEEDFQI